MTYSEQLNEALACDTKEQADAWLQKEIVRFGVEYGKTPEEAREIILVNLGYMAGYYDHETAQKVHKLFGAVHPIFGSADYHKTVTPERAFALGEQFMGKGEHEQKSE